MHTNDDKLKDFAIHYKSDKYKTSIKGSNNDKHTTIKLLNKLILKTKNN